MTRYQLLGTLKKYLFTWFWFLPPTVAVLGNAFTLLRTSSSQCRLIAIYCLITGIVLPVARCQNWWRRLFLSWWASISSSLFLVLTYPSWDLQDQRQLWYLTIATPVTHYFHNWISCLPDRNICIGLVPLHTNFVMVVVNTILCKILTDVKTLSRSLSMTFDWAWDDCK
jgi:hypothetical protein